MSWGDSSHGSFLSLNSMIPNPKRNSRRNSRKSQGLLANPGTSGSRHRITLRLQRSSPETCVTNTTNMSMIRTTIWHGLNTILFKIGTRWTRSWGKQRPSSMLARRPKRRSEISSRISIIWSSKSGLMEWRLRLKTRSKSLVCSNSSSILPPRLIKMRQNY